MKIKNKLLAALTTLLLLVSCAEDTNTLNSNEQQVDINIIASTNWFNEDHGEISNDIHYGDYIDPTIKSLRVLGYRADGTLSFNTYLSESALQTVNAYGVVSAKAMMRTGTFQVVFIANEISDAALSAELGAIIEITDPSKATADEITHSKLDYIKTLFFNQSAFDESKYIPMVTVKENVTINGNTHVVESDKTSHFGAWAVAMERIGIRVQVKVTMSKAEALTLNTNSITIGNIPSEVYLFTDKTNVPSSPIEKTYTCAASFDEYKRDYPTYAGYYTDNDDTRTFIFKRLILPETRFTPVTTENKAMVLSMTFTDGKKSGKIGTKVNVTGAETPNYTILRNSFLDVLATILNLDPEFNITVNVLPWEAETKIESDL
ncbi:fimbrial protein [Bacteroides sp. 519]|uniref:fimbrial protein n=1 Tax=Bacteroides sp. 519 TaxID=2302937 RepID=UPI0013D6881C|nr:fimbrial protein [Bacteroides sp. 519]NDV60586.1 DUF4906 domain-containing protein [Bacteroides sp. 519]